MAVTPNPTRYGDLKLFKTTVDGHDISQGVLQVRVYQDIFTPTWTAQVDIDDTANWLMRMPIMLGSIVTVTAQTQNNSPLDDQKVFNFMIYSIGNRQLLGGNHQSYTLFLAAKPFLLNQKTRVSRSFNSTKATDAVSQIVKNSLGGTVQAEACDNAVSVIVPNWSPFNAVAWFCKHATKSGAADYVFFQTDDNQYAMRSLESIYSSSTNSSGIIFDQHPASMTDQNANPLYDYSVSITSFQVEHFDGMANLSAGMYSNKKVSLDFISHEWAEKTFKYGDDCPADAQYKSWSSTFFDDAENSNVTFMPKHPGMSANGPSYLDAQDTWEPSRKTAFMKLEQEKLTIQLPGSIGLWRAIGKNCKVNLPSHQDFDRSNTLDKYRKGNYIISAIAHVIGIGGYYCNIECLKKRMETTPQPIGSSD